MVKNRIGSSMLHNKAGLQGEIFRNEPQDIATRRQALYIDRQIADKRAFKPL